MPYWPLNFQKNLQFILSPRNSEDAAPPYWTEGGRRAYPRPQWKNIFSDYGHHEIQYVFDTGHIELWIEESYNAWLKRNGLSHLTTTNKE